MTARNPARTIGILALVVAVLGGAWLVFSGSGPATGAAAGPGEVVPDGSGELGRPGDLGGADARGPGQVGADRAGGAQPAVERRAKEAETVVRGRIAGAGRASLDGGKARLLESAGKPATFATFLSFTNPEQFKRLEKLFKPRPVVRETTLDAGGRFVFEDPEPGRYELGLDHPLLRLAGRTEFRVERGEQKDLGRIRVEPAGSLLVVVTDPSGGPVAGAELQLQADFDPMEFADPEKLGDMFRLFRRFLPERGTTDEKGLYVFGGLRASGKVLLQVEAEGRAPARRVVHVADGMQKVARVVLGRAAALRVRVRNAAGDPIAGARVIIAPEAATGAPAPRMLVAGQDFGRLRARTGPDGLAEERSILPGPAKLAVRAAGYLAWAGDVVLDAGKTVARTVTLERGLSVSGVVLDEHDTPIEGARVGNVPELGKSFMGIELSSFVPAELLAARPTKRGTATDAAGRFTVQGLRPGEEVHLMAVAQGHAPGRVGPVEPGAKDLVLRLDSLGSIEGRVVREEDGEPVEGFRVYCARTQYLVFEGRVGRMKAGGEAGAFTVEDVPQGKQTLVVEAPDRTAVRRTVEVGEGATEVGDVVLAPASAIEGIVADEQGRPVEGASVRLAKGGFADFEMLAKMTGAEVVTTGPDGAFRLSKVPAKRVKLIAEKKGYALARSRVVRVERGKVAGGVRIVLTGGGSLHGRIVDTQGAPQVGWRLQVTGIHTATVRMAETDAAGEVRIAGLAPGIYQVQAFPPDWMAQISQVTRETTKTTDADAMPDMGKLFSATMKHILQTKATVRAGREAEFELVAEAAGGRSGLTRVDGVVTVGGRPVGRGFVELLELGGAPRMEFAQVRDGRFRFAGILPGAYRARVRAGFFSAAAFHAEVVRIPRRSDYRLELALPGGRIAGRVVGAEDGEPAAHVMIKLTSRDEAKHFNPTQVEDVGQGMWLTDGKGRFAFDGLAGGVYAITARDLAFVSGKSRAGAVSDIRLGDGERREDIELRIGGGGRVTVRVRDGRGVVQHALVRLTDGHGRPADMVQALVTDEQGEAVFQGLPAGTYRVLADAEQGSPALSGAILVAEGGDEAVTVTLQPGVPVRLIVEGEVPQARSGEVLVFSIWDPEGRLVRAGPAPVATILEKADRAKGGMSIGSLRPGKYTLRLESPTLGVLAAEREVKDEKQSVWVVNAAARTIEKR